METAIRTIVGIIVFLALTLSGTAIYIYSAHLTPLKSTPAEILVEIKPGMSTYQIGNLLEKQGIIKSARGFAWIVGYSDKADQLKAGEYVLDPSSAPKHIMNLLIEGKTLLHPITIPEGFTMLQVVELVAKTGFSDVESLIMAASDSEMLSRFGIEGTNAEGYLMPETYYFRKNAHADEIIGKMLSTFFSKITSIRESYQHTSRLSFKEVIILASIIEKETANKEEYALISSVYHNRLKRKMRLQADPTVIYALPNFDGNIRKVDLMYDSPYNTYRYAGLPPGPISNPGLDAIIAAYNPEKTKYLYFVAMNSEGRHHFSNTLKEHNIAVRRYQLGNRG